MNKILPSSLVDGPGNRSAVFLQGCGFRCRYCHNPETQRLCSGCGDCVAVCPAGALRREGAGVAWDRGACTGCDACLAACPHSASPKVRWMDGAEVFYELRPHRPFIRGITASGGECSLWPEFLTQLFTLARGDGLTCLMDSNGGADLEGLPALMDVCDGVMLDVKAWDEGVHRTLTGCGNGTVRRNLDFLAGCGKLAEVRLVCAPGHTDPEAVLRGVAGALGGLRETVPLKLIGFRPFGVRGALAAAPATPKSELERLEALAGTLGFGRVVRI